MEITVYKTLKAIQARAYTGPSTPLMANSVKVFAAAQLTPVLVHGVIFVLQVSLVVLGFQAADVFIASVQAATLDLQPVKAGHKQSQGRSQATLSQYAVLAMPSANTRSWL